MSKNKSTISVKRSSSTGKYTVAKDDKTNGKDVRAGNVKTFVKSFYSKYGKMMSQLSHE